MHIAMESIGQPPPPQPTKEKEKDKHKEPRKHRGQTSAAGRAGTTNTPINTDRDEAGHSASDTDHAGSGRDNRSGAKKAAPAEPPIATHTGEHFAERKEAIQNIMKKVLTALSQQVTEFHQLPPPEITFPASPSRQTTQPLPQTPPQPSTLTVPSPSHPPHAHQTPRSKVSQAQRHSPLGPHGQPAPRISIPAAALPIPDSHSQPVTPSKVKAHSVISGDGTLHESPVSIQ
ncbi:hypothetical protein FRC10_011688 [Ceratobasidium sp. 414]|nr:hypothetical protein FRC10_011688 [Ceratobasidium sp. 414]